ncbi:MAG: hypothetical protein ABEJ07_06235 [Candidatus Nanohaloarchaea archaeon]
MLPDILPDDDRLILLPGIALILLRIEGIELWIDFEIIFSIYLLAAGILFESGKIVGDEESFIEGENLSEEARSIYNSEFDSETNVVYSFFKVSAAVFTLIKIYSIGELLLNLQSFSTPTLGLGAYLTFMLLTIGFVSKLSNVLFIFAIAIKDEDESDKWKDIRDEYMPHRKNE